MYSTFIFQSFVFRFGYAFTSSEGLPDTINNLVKQNLGLNISRRSFHFILTKNEAMIASIFKDKKIPLGD